MSSANRISKISNPQSEGSDIDEKIREVKGLKDSSCVEDAEEIYCSFSTKDIEKYIFFKEKKS